MKNLKDTFIENDKVLAPFLLAASFNGFIKFVDCYSKEGVVYWRFSSKEQAQILVDKFLTKTEPHIPAKDIFEAINTFWKQVLQTKNKEGNHESL